jgi:hypothetical protein
MLTATLSSAIQLLPGSLPAGTAKLKFQRTKLRIPQLIENMDRLSPQGDAKFISIQVAQDGDYGWSILSRRDKKVFFHFSILISLIGLIGSDMC